jgi:hypothetical protein
VVETVVVGCHGMAAIYGKPKGTPFLCSRRSTRSSRRSTLFLQPEKKKKVFLKFLFFIFLAFIYSFDFQV